MNLFYYSHVEHVFYLLFKVCTVYDIQFEISAGLIKMLVILSVRFIIDQYLNNHEYLELGSFLKRENEKK